MILRERVKFHPYSVGTDTLKRKARSTVIS